MTRRALRMCSAPGCPRVVESGRCPAHQARHEQRERERKREYETRRPPRSVPTWTPEWRNLRRAFLGEHPYCECGARAVHVHHRVPVSVNPALALVRDNLLACCSSCHATIEANTPGHWKRKAP